MAGRLGRLRGCHARLAALAGEQVRRSLRLATMTSTALSSPVLPVSVPPPGEAGWHRGAEVEVWRGGHAVRLGLWALFVRSGGEGSPLVIAALVSPGEAGWTWEVAAATDHPAGPRALLAAMSEAQAQLGRGRDERRAAVLLRRWSAGATRAAAA